MTVRLLTPASPPRETPCEHCRTYRFAGTHCPRCKEPRSTYIAAKRICAQPRPITAPPPFCRYFPQNLCDCGLRGTCVEAA